MLQVAKFYLSMNKTIPILEWFGRAPGTFFVAVGGDGAPFGKENQATSWLISFLNVVTRVANCDDNFLILRANCSEEHPALMKYAKQLRTEIECPWPYDGRVKVARQVNTYKQTTLINKPVKQHRNLITKFIANKASRQEFKPLLGPIIDKAVCEPLHLGTKKL